MSDIEDSIGFNNPQDYEIKEEVFESLKTGYDRQVDVKDGMKCPVCGSIDTWRLKSLYSPYTNGDELTEELWYCGSCNKRWNLELKITVLETL